MTSLFRHTILLLLLCTGISASAQKEKLPDTNTPLNKLDANGKRTGSWWITHKAAMGESSSAEFGNYFEGLKYGKWYKLDNEGDITAIEMYKNDKLDGEVKYYEKGVLYCTGNYRTFKTGPDRDTIVVVDPDTHSETLKEVFTEENTMRHGIWRFYDETTGKLLKEEEYQVDSLIWKKAYTSPQDSLRMQKRENLMPHNKKRYKKEQANPKGQVLN